MRVSHSSLMAIAFCLLLLPNPSVRGQELILETPITPVGNSNHPASVGSSLGILVPVTVGADPVEIAQIGVYGQANTTVSLAWVLFFDASAPELIIPAETITAGGPQWHDSPVLDTPFVLNANTTYWIGPMISGPTNGFSQPFNFPGTQVFGDGVTQQFGANRNVFGPTSAPTMGGSGSLQTIIRLYRPATIPEPNSSLLLGAMSMLGLICRRSRRLNA